MLIPELNWLPHSLFKGIPYPIVVFQEDKGQSYGGYYTHNSGILTIVEHEFVPSTIAHELKHYLQELSGNPPTPTNFKVVGTYEQSIKNYFCSVISEFEALLFEYKYAKSWVNEWWLRKLVLDQ